MLTTEQQYLWAFLLEAHKEMHIKQWLEQVDFAMELGLMTKEQHYGPGWPGPTSRRMGCLMTTDWADKIASHPFSKKVLSDIKPLADKTGEAIEEDLKEPKLLHGMFTLDETKAENYYFRVFSTISKLVSAFENLQQAMQLQLMTSPAPEVIGMSKDDWRGYHFHHYQTTHGAIYDLSLLLTKETLNLELKPSECTYEGVLNHEKVAGDSKLEQSLKDIKSEFLLEVKGIDTELMGEDEFSKLYPHSFWLPANKRFFPSELLSRNLEQDMEEHTEDMTQAEQVDFFTSGIQRIADKTCELLDALQPHYKTTITNLSDDGRETGTGSGDQSANAGES